MLRGEIRLALKCGAPSPTLEVFESSISRKNLAHSLQCRRLISFGCRHRGKRALATWRVCCFVIPNFVDVCLLLMFSVVFRRFVRKFSISSSRRFKYNSVSIRQSRVATQQMQCIIVGNTVHVRRWSPIVWFDIPNCEHHHVLIYLMSFQRQYRP